jgi:hypothetical protein
MDEDAPVTPAVPHGSSVAGRGARRRICRYALLVGAIGGIIIGVVDDFSFATSGWSLAIASDSPDVPLFWIVVTVDEVLHFMKWTKSDTTFWEVALILYWAAVGVLFAALCCLVWAGWRRLGVVVFRRAIFVGSVGGLVVAALNLFASAGSREPEYFRILHWPATSAMGVAETWLNPHAWVSVDVYAYYRLLVLVCYWAAVGSLLAIVFCLLRSGTGRKSTRETGVIGE